MVKNKIRTVCKQLALLLFALFVTMQVWSQYNVKIVVTSIATKTNDDAFICGNFNNWKPNELKYKLKPFAAGRRYIVLYNVPEGVLEFKFTRGNFERVECAGNGADIENRKIQVTGDQTVQLTINGWKDDYPLKPKPNTASAQVRLVDSAFSIASLQRKRGVYIYLPRSYQSSNQTYPVVYFMDGQNVFNEQTAFAQEWGIDECLDTLSTIKYKECIVVAVNHGDAYRMQEYSAFPFEIPQTGKMVKPEAKEMAAFVAGTLKTFIDKNYRTKKDKDNNFVAGSSLGANFSLYLLTQYPELYGGGLIFSPALWAQPQLLDVLAKTQFQSNKKIYIYAGENEDENMVPDVEKLYKMLSKQKNIVLTKSINPLGKHEEKYWRLQLEEAFKFILKK